MRRRHIATMLSASLIAMAAMPAPAAAQQIDRIVAFGDSLADTGNALQLLLSNPLTPAPLKAQLQALYPTGRFSGGTNYIDSLSDILNAPVLNYAVGGAQTGPSNQFTGLPGFTQETAIFLSGTTPPGTIFPPNDGFQEGDLLALSIGINDARAFYQFNPAATIAQAQAAALTSIVNATNNLDLLVGAGAPTISYVALNAGLTPDVLATPTLQALGNAFSTTFNAGFQETLAGYAADGVTVHYLDGATVLANVAENPEAFGIENLYCPGAPDPTCFISAAGYLFYADGIHPTSDGGRILAQYVAAQLDAPLTLQAPSDLGVDISRQWGRTLSSRVDIARGRESAEGVRLYVVGDAFSRDIDQSDSNYEFEDDGVGLTIGAETAFGALTAGAAVNYSRSQVDFSNNASRVKSTSWQIGGYAGYSAGGLFLQGHAGYGKDEHRIRRTGVIDNLSAEPDGTHVTAGAKAGYLIGFDGLIAGLRVGPIVAIDHARAKVDGYTENGDAALRLNVDDQDLKATTGQLGIEGRLSLIEGVRSHGSFTMEKEFSPDARLIRFAQTSAPGIVNQWNVDRDPGSYFRVSSGNSIDLWQGATLNTALSSTFGRDGGQEMGFQLGFNMGF